MLGVGVEVLYNVISTRSFTLAELNGKLPRVERCFRTILISILNCFEITRSCDWTSPVIILSID